MHFFPSPLRYFKDQISADEQLAGIYISFLL